MTDVYSGQSQFVLLVDNRRRWFDTKTVLLITIICLPVVIFCGIYTVLIRTNESILYPMTDKFEVPSSFIDRAKMYSSSPKDSNFTKLFQLNDNVEVDEFKLVCYYNFPDNDPIHLSPQRIPPYLCTHINVAFARIDNNTISLTDDQLFILNILVQFKSLNKDLKILLSVGGAGNADGFSGMVLNHANRKMFIRSVLDLVKTYKIDGVDLDWEFPGYNPGSDKNQRMHFTQLLEELRTAINRHTKYKFLVTVAVAAPAFIVDLAYDVTYMNQFVDYINLMSYDFHFYTKLTPFTGLNAPLFESSQDQGYFSALNINYSANYWVSKGMDRNKIIIGLPTYGHTFRLTNTQNYGLYAPARGYGKLGDNGFADYGQVCKFLNMNEISPVFNTESLSPYASKYSEWVSFDDEKSLTFKAEYIKKKKFGGAMVYSLNADDYMGSCILDSRYNNQPFPLVRRIQEVLNKNYSIF